MILCDHDIKLAVEQNKLGIDPYNLENVQPASYDVSLSNLFQVFLVSNRRFIDPREDQRPNMQRIETPEGNVFVLDPGKFALGSTCEVIRNPHNLVSRLEGKSSLGRLGLVVHATAGYIDPGFEGRITLELFNMASLPILLYPGMKIGQLSFARMTGCAEIPYGDSRLGSKYQGQMEPTVSLMHKNYEDPK